MVEGLVMPASARCPTLRAPRTSNTRYCGAQQVVSGSNALNQLCMVAANDPLTACHVYQCLALKLLYRCQIGSSVLNGHVSVTIRLWATMQMAWVWTLLEALFLFFHRLLINYSCCHIFATNAGRELNCADKPILSVTSPLRPLIWHSIIHTSLNTSTP